MEWVQVQGLDWIVKITSAIIGVGGVGTMVWRYAKRHFEIYEAVGKIPSLHEGIQENRESIKNLESKVGAVDTKVDDLTKRVVSDHKALAEKMDDRFDRLTDKIVDVALGKHDVDTEHSNG